MASLQEIKSLTPLQCCKYTPLQNSEAVDKDGRGQQAFSASINGVASVLGVAWVTKVWIGAVFTNFVVTLAVFPAIASLIKSVDAGSVSDKSHCRIISRSHLLLTIG